MGELTHGARQLGKGFAFLKTRPKLFVLGVIPALVVFLVLGALFVVLALQASNLAAWATPFADDWADPLRGLLRLLLVLALLLGTFVLFSAVFVGLTLAVGDRFYERIWRETEAALGGEVPPEGLGFLRSLRDGVALMGLGLLTSVLVLASGFVPFVGPLVGAVLGVLLSGRLLARELVARPLEARGFDRDAQRALLAPHRTRLLGFGVLTQLCFLIPLGGVLVMPAAVVGATMLARDALDAAPR